jgi:hypothetical protein
LGDNDDVSPSPCSKAMKKQITKEKNGDKDSDSAKSNIDKEHDEVSNIEDLSASSSIKRNRKKRKKRQISVEDNDSDSAKSSNEGKKKITTPKKNIVNTGNKQHDKSLSQNKTVVPQFEVLLLLAKSIKDTKTAVSNTRVLNKILKFIDYLWQKQKKQNQPFTKKHATTNISLFDVSFSIMKCCINNSLYY